MEMSAAKGTEDREEERLVEGVGKTETFAAPSRTRNVAGHRSAMKNEFDPMLFSRLEQFSGDIIQTSSVWEVCRREA